MRLVLFTFLLMVNACNYDNHQLPDDFTPEQGKDVVCTPDGTPADTGTAGVVTYEQVKTEVFETRCLSCHGSGSGAGGVNLATYGSAASWASQIKFAVQSGTMPKSPNPPLPQAEKELVIAWVDAGAPSSQTGSVSCSDIPPDGNPPSPPSSPVEEPLSAIPADSEIDYNLVRNKIFKFRCFACHSNAGGNASGLNLETYFNTIDEIDDIEEVIREQEMPPPPRPFLNNIEQTTILRWIDLGAPE